MAEHVDMADREYITVSDITEILGCNRRTVLRWIVAGEFEAIRFPGAVGYRVDKESFEAFLRSRSVVNRAKKELRNG